MDVPDGSKDKGRKNVKKLMSVVMAMVFLLGLAVPAVAQDDDQVMRGFIKDDASQFMIAMEMQADGSSEAKLMYSFLNDTEMIEDELDVMVVESTPADRSQLRTLGADEMMLYAVVTDGDFTPGLIVVARNGDSVFMMALIGTTSGTNLDGSLFAEVSIDVIKNGVEDMEEPDGYIEQDMDDDAGIDL